MSSKNAINCTIPNWYVDNSSTYKLYVARAIGIMYSDFIFLFHIIIYLLSEIYHVTIFQMQIRFGKPRNIMCCCYYGLTQMDVGDCFGFFLVYFLLFVAICCCCLRLTSLFVSSNGYSNKLKKKSNALNEQFKHHRMIQ